MNTILAYENRIDKLQESDKRNGKPQNRRLIAKLKRKIGKKQTLEQGQ